MTTIFSKSLLACLMLTTAATAENWSRFRGPNGAGQSDDNQIPTTWQPTNFLWKQPLPGTGHSSPVVWDKQLFLTWADGASGAQTIAAFDVETGAASWQKQFEAPKYHINDLNSFASSTPAVDAQYLYVLWLKDGKVMLAALNHQGEERWRRDVGPFKEVHGFGVSPIVVDDLVYVTRASGTDSGVTAFDRTTGDVRWNLPQDAGTTAFSTPCLLDPNAQHKVLLTTSTSSGLIAIDALTGKILWQGLKDDLDQRCVSSPIIGAGMILVGSGQGGNGKATIAVRPGDHDSSPQEVYRLKQSVPQVPTPVIAGDLLFVWSDHGVVSCYDLATGKQHWRERISGDFHSSPIRVGDRIFCFSRGGDAFVIAADIHYQLLARNELGELCAATPAIANGRMFVRTESTLLCIGQPPSN
jgi:outer membrane protein assembly factor BamB